MPSHCWSCVATGQECYPYSGGSMSRIQCTISNSVNNPPLPLPDYTYKGPVDWCPYYSGEPSSTYLYWEEFCNPATNPYQDSGPYVIDSTNARQTTTSGGLFLDKGIILAIKYIPSGFCTPYIVFHDAYNLAPAGVKTIVEIRENDPITNYPKGVFDPSSMPDDQVLSRVTIDVFNPNNRYNYAVPINAILNSSPDIAHWIVIYSSDYMCGLVGSSYRRVEFSSSTTGGYNLASFKNTDSVCEWVGDTTIKSVALVTYKSDTCRGKVLVSDYGFAIDGVFIQDECFKTLADIKNKNVMIGVQYSAPRVYANVRFNIVYIRPNGTMYLGTHNVTTTQLGNNEVFLDTGEKYMPGPNLLYSDIQVTPTVTRVV